MHEGLQAEVHVHTRHTGKEVSVKVVVDATILGGIVAQVGDTVIDGSVRRRLEQLRESL